MEKIKRPERKPDLDLSRAGTKCSVEIWIEESLFYIHNGYLEEDECLDRIRSKGIVYYNPIDFLESIVADPEDTRKHVVLTFLLERGLFDSTESS